MNGDVCVSPKGEILNTFLEYRKWTGVSGGKGERNRQPRLNRERKRICLVGLRDASGTESVDTAEGRVKDGVKNRAIT